MGSIQGMLRDVKTMGMITSITHQIDSLHAQAQEMVSDDPELAPELAAFSSHLSQAALAAGRALKFMSARIAVEAPEE